MKKKHIDLPHGYHWEDDINNDNDSNEDHEEQT